MRFKILAAFSLLVLATPIYAQLKGKATYAISHKPKNPSLQGVEKQLPEQCTYLGDGKNWKVTWFNELGGDYVIIYDHTVDSITHLVSVGQQQISVTNKENELKYFLAGASNFEIENQGMVSTYKLLSRDDMVLDETYFQIPSAFTRLSKDEYLRLLR